MPLRPWTALAAVSSAITACDLAQPAMLDWRPKFFGALGGALLYTLVAGGAVAHRRWAAMIALGMPIVPIAALAASAVGVGPVQPDAWMIAIFGLQLAAAALAGRALTRSAPPR